ncbi:hypothetical protein HDU76_004336, partial [Blyttiomyces sp. JEL0837]
MAAGKKRSTTRKKKAAISTDGANGDDNQPSTYATTTSINPSTSPLASSSSTSSPMIKTITHLPPEIVANIIKCIPMTKKLYTTLPQINRLFRQSMHLIPKCIRLEIQLGCDDPPPPPFWILDTSARNNSKPHINITRSSLTFDWNLESRYELGGCCLEVGSCAVHLSSSAVPLDPEFLVG